MSKSTDARGLFPDDERSSRFRDLAVIFDLKN